MPPMPSRCPVFVNMRQTSSAKLVATPATPERPHSPNDRGPRVCNVQVLLVHPDKRKRSDANEEAVHLAGSKIIFHDPGTITGEEPDCPVCAKRKVARKQMGSNYGLRRCVPRDFVAVTQYKFAGQCRTDGCHLIWKDGTGGGSEAMYSYQAPLYHQFPKWAQHLMEQHVYIDGQGTAFSTAIHDLGAWGLSNGMLFSDQEASVKHINRKRFDRNLIMIADYRKRVPSANTLDTFATAHTPAPNPAVLDMCHQCGYTCPNWQVFKTHSENHFYLNEYVFALLFIQGGPITRLASDQHFKMRKFIRQAGANVVTGMELMTNVQTNTTVHHVYNKDGAHANIKNVYQAVSERRARFRDASTPAGKHTQGRVTVDYAGGVYTCPFRSADEDDLEPWEVQAIYSDSPGIEEQYAQTYLPECRYSPVPSRYLHVRGSGEAERTCMCVAVERRTGACLAGVSFARLHAHCKTASKRHSVPTTHKCCTAVGRFPKATW